MKSNLTPNLTPIASAVAVLVMSVAMSAHAQQAAPVQQEVVVTGIRASLQSAVNIKRNANSVVDAVSSEDIGKLPDSDVGEALGRVPGVTVGRAFGQGASVSVRGSDPQMTYTTLNGQTVASTGWYDQQSIDRSFNYSLLPSELIGGMEVYKSSQADLTEGGIGGTVIVKTRKPLDMAANSGVASIKLGKGSVSTDLSKDFSGLYNWKNEANTFGILVAGARDTGDYIRRGVEANATWDDDVASATFAQERKRTAFSLSVQARPVQGMDLSLDYLKLSLVGDNANNNQYHFQNKSCKTRNAANMCVLSESTAANTGMPFFQTWARTGEMTSDSLMLNGSYKLDGMKIDMVVGTTKADGGTSMTTNYGFANGNLPKWTGTIDATGHQIKLSPSSSQVVTLANLPEKVGTSGSWATSRGPNTDKENYGQADLTMKLDWAGLSSFKTGFRAAEHTFDKRVERSVFANGIKDASTASLYSGNIGMGSNGWDSPRANIAAMMADTNANVTGWVAERGGYGSLNEKNTALYGMFNFEHNEFHGNFGLRYIKTNVSSSGYAVNGVVDPTDIDANKGWAKTKKEETSSYSDVLPTLNVAYDLNKNIILRGTAGQAITRPNYGNMFLTSLVGYADTNPGNESISYGTATLKPMKSTQFDLGLEYYYGKGNLISFMYFHKDIENFITTQTAVNQSIGIVDPVSLKDSWTVNRYINAGGGKIDGLETQINHAFDHGFGVAANYTFANANAPAVSYADRVSNFTNSSKHNVNVVGYWENPSYSARAAYNWRSEYMVRETGYYGNRMHDAFGSLDLSFGWNINKNLRMQFDVTNVLKADDVQYGAAEVENKQVAGNFKAGYPAWSFTGESTYKLSLSAKF